MMVEFIAINHKTEINTHNHDRDQMKWQKYLNTLVIVVVYCIINIYTKYNYV